jgi:sensor histidine kinase YesM
MYVPLERELSLVKSYVEIEKARFGDKFELELHIEVPLGSKIPFLSLQPLIENAINHGLRKKSGKGIVKVSILPVSEGLMVSVEDDGQGIPEEKLKVLLETDNGHGIGLWNIDRRLKKLCGKGLSITSIYGKGTKVSYTIPFVSFRI